MQTGIILSLKNQTRVLEARSASSGPGFVSLKGKTELVETVPETEESGALRHALEKINTAGTPFFTTSCGISVNSDEGGCWARGYLGFCFNYVEIARDSPNYFLLFEQFNRHLLDSSFDLPIEFHFQIEAAHFSGINDIGYAASVWITTAEFPSTDPAVMIWNQGIGLLADFLSSFENPELPAIF
jgi:hypothetical protein